MDANLTKKKPWTRGEKFLLGAILLTVILAAFGGLWWTRTGTEPVVSVPTPAMPARNAFGVLLDAAGAENGPVDDAMMSPPPPPTRGGPAQHVYSPTEKAPLVQANTQALSLLHQGLALPYQNPPVRSFATLMPYYGRFRKLARLTTLVGQVREAQGDWAGAVASHLDAIQLGAEIPHGSPLIGELVGVACEAIGRRPLWDDAQHLTAPQARAAARRLEGIMASRAPYPDVLQEEEWTTQASLMETFRRPGWRSEIRSLAMSGGDDSDSAATVTPARFAQMLFISKKTIMDDYTARMDQLRQEARQPFTAPTPTLPPTDGVTEALTEYLGPSARFKDVYTTTEDSLLLVTLALRAYRLEHGAYPATLAALAPADLPRVPDDPCAPLGPLRYRKTGSTYLLYSVGPDGKDDGGTPVFDAAKGAPRPGEHDARYYVVAGSQGDIVAGLNQ